MNHRLARAIAVIFLGLVPAVAVLAQSGEDTPLGDVARAYRHQKQPPATAQKPVIDNDNMTQVMDDAQKQRQSGAAVISFDNLGKTFQVAAPDVTCSLAFNASSASLLSAPYIAQDLPESELGKLDGPATIDGDTLQLTVYNGSTWTVNEITVGFTVVRLGEQQARGGNGKIVPAAAISSSPTEKRSDITVLFHLKGTAAPLSTTVFREPLGTALGPDRDWHWAIVDAKGIPQATPPVQPGQ